MTLFSMISLARQSSGPKSKNKGTKFFLAKKVLNSSILYGFAKDFLVTITTPNVTELNTLSAMSWLLESL